MNGSKKTKIIERWKESEWVSSVYKQKISLSRQVLAWGADFQSGKEKLSDKAADEHSARVRGVSETACFFS
jgi:hypothetical protein